MSNMVMVSVIAAMLILTLRRRITDNADISTKKIKKNLVRENLFISGVSVLKTAGITDIAVKKKTKDLTFIFGCAKRMW
jgi:hypothetical protein